MEKQLKIKKSMKGMAKRVRCSFSPWTLEKHRLQVL